MPRNGRNIHPIIVFPLLLLLYGLSGAAALVYQVLWVRLLGLTFGVTVHAAATVLASFMAGLAIGSTIGGRLADRTRRPLRTFGLIELGAGLTALASPALLGAVQSLYVRWHPGTSEGDLRLTLLRFLLSALIVIVPAILMGATLPVVVRAARAYAGHAARLGVLYGTNTIGAMIGTLAAGLWMIPAIGLWRSFLSAAAINAAVGLTAMVAGRAAAQPADTGNSELRIPNSELLLPPRWATASIVLLSGFVALALEVVWFRVLAAIILRPTTYAFTIMLAAVLAGIGLGSYVSGLIMRRSRRWGLWLAAAEIGTGAAALLSFRGMAWSLDVMRWANDVIARYLPDHLAPLLVGTFLSIFPAALMMGIALPIALASWTSGGAHPGRRLGNIYALNVAGSIAGSLAGGFVLLPLLGSHRSLVLLSVLMIAGAFLLIAGLSLRAKLGLTLAAGALTAIGIVTLPDLYDVILPLRYRGQETLWRKEGIQTTVAITEQRTRAGLQRSMLLNGLHQANDSAGMVAFHKHLALLPLALHPNPHALLSVGLGGGATPGGASEYPGLQVDVVELSSAVVEGARFFAHVNNDLLNKPNVRVMVGDGRTHLLVTRRKYDIVTADAIIPTHAGAGALYSADYYRMVKRVLAPRGLVAQWVGPTGTEQWKMLVRTFLSVFPDATLWSGQILIGGHGPLELDRGELLIKEQIPEAMRILGRDGTLPLSVLLTRFTAGPDELRAFVGDGPILTDDQPRVEYFLSLPAGDPHVDLSPLKGDATKYLRRQ